MGNSTSSCITLQSYEQIYNASIRPKLESIDLFIKTNDAPFNIEEAASVLDLQVAELINLMKENNIIELNRLTFFNVILCSSSDICRLIAKQWRYQSLKSYTPQVISDIYSLNIHKVNSAFEELNVSSIKPHEIIEIFKRIHSSIYT